MSKIKVKHPRLRDMTLSLIDGEIYIDEHGIFEGDLSDAQRARISARGWEIISEEAPKAKRRRTTRKKTASKSDQDG